MEHVLPFAQLPLHTIKGGVYTTKVAYSSGIKVVCYLAVGTSSFLTK